MFVSSKGLKTFRRAIQIINVFDWNVFYSCLFFAVYLIEVLIEFAEIVFEIYFLSKGMVHGTVDGHLAAVYETGDHFGDVPAWHDGHAQMTYEASPRAGGAGGEQAV